MSIHAKMIEFHKKFKGTKKTGLNPHFGQAHFTLEDLVHAITPVMNELGMYILHRVEDGCLMTAIIDEAGESLSSSIPMVTNGNPQAAGSAVTYYKRYNICALLNIAESDDDGAAANAESAKTISDQELIEIRDELEALGRDEKRFCAYLGIEKLEEMNVGMLPRARAAIKQAHEALGK